MAKKSLLNFPDPATLDETALHAELRRMQTWAAELTARLESLSALSDRLCGSLHSTTRVAHELGDLLARLVAARVSDDTAAAEALLDEIIRDNRILPPPGGKPAAQRLH